MTIGQTPPDSVAMAITPDWDQDAAAHFFQVVVDPFEEELKSLLNRYSKENGSNTPDFQLARYLMRCLEVFDETVRFREGWYGRNPNKGPGQ